MLMACKGACCAKGFLHQVGGNHETKVPGMKRCRDLIKRERLIGGRSRTLFMPRLT